MDDASTGDDTKPVAPPPKIISPIFDFQPDWKTDGHGLRGPQDERAGEVARPTEMSFGIGERNASSDPLSGNGRITVTVEDASGYVAGSGVAQVTKVDVLTFDQDNFEIFDGGGGQCVVKLKTCPATCPP